MARFLHPSHASVSYISLPFPLSSNSCLPPVVASDVSDRQLREEVEGRAVVLHGPVTGMRTDLSGPNQVPEILDPTPRHEEEREKVRE